MELGLAGAAGPGAPSGAGTAGRRLVDDMVMVVMHHVVMVHDVVAVMAHRVGRSHPGRKRQRDRRRERQGDEFQGVSSQFVAWPPNQYRATGLRKRPDNCLYGKASRRGNLNLTGSA